MGGRVFSPSWSRATAPNSSGKRVVEIGRGGVAATTLAALTRPPLAAADAARPRQRDPHELGRELSDKRVPSRCVSSRLFANASETQSSESARKTISTTREARRRKNKKTTKKRRVDADDAVSGAPGLARFRPGGAGVDPRGRRRGCGRPVRPDGRVRAAGRDRRAAGAKKKKKRRPARASTRIEASRKKITTLMSP